MPADLIYLLRCDVTNSAMRSGRESNRCYQPSAVEGRVRRSSNRVFMNAVFYIAKTGAPWRDLPERFCPWKTVHTKLSRWNKRKVFDRILERFTDDADHESAIADSTYIRAHQHAAGGNGGPNSVYWTLSRRPYHQNPRSRGRSR